MDRFSRRGKLEKVETRPYTHARIGWRGFLKDCARERDRAKEKRRESGEGEGRWGEEEKERYRSAGVSTAIQQRLDRSARSSSLKWSTSLSAYTAESRKGRNVGT